jgi:antitoxin YefM
MKFNRRALHGSKNSIWPGPCHRARNPESDASERSPYLFDCVVESNCSTFPALGQYPVHVKSITYSAARENLASTINRVCEDQAPIVITRNRDQAVVMLSLAEYESLQETAYLLRSPANAKRLIAAVETLNRGKGIKRKLKA